MSDVSGTYWQRQAGVYRQPLVVEPPQDQNANNARAAIWHLGRSFDLEVYPSAEGWRLTDGRHDMADMRLVTVRGVIQPDGSSNELVRGAEGEHGEGRIIVHLDSHEPFNVEAAAINVDVFPDGVRLTGPDSDGEMRGHAMIVRWAGRRWKVLSVAEHWEGADEEVTATGAVYRAVCGLFRQRSHERDAKPGMTTPEWGPE